MSSELKQTKVIGSIFPILRKHVSNIFRHERNVFVKFTKLHLETGSTIVFYISGEKLLFGEAKIRHVEKLDPDEAFSRYRGRLFLNEKEYVEYVEVSPIN